MKVNDLLVLGERLLLKKVDADEKIAGVYQPDVAEADRATQLCEVVGVPIGGLTLHRYDRTATEFVQEIVVGDQVYIAKHKGYGVVTAAGDELIVADVVDVLLLVAAEKKES